MQQVSWEHRNGQLSEQIIEALLQWCARLAGIQHWKLFRNKNFERRQVSLPFRQHQLKAYYKAGLSQEN